MSSESDEIKLKIEIAERHRVEAETERAKAETGRAKAETERAEAETGRAKAETERAEAETGRAEAVKRRVEAESNRAGAEHMRAKCKRELSEEEWKKRKWWALWIALIIVALDVLALALGEVLDSMPVALSLACVGVITFIGVLVLVNHLSHDPELAKKEMRKAIAASFTLVYLAVLAYVLSGTLTANTELAETVVRHFTWIVGIIIVFYFGSRLGEKLIDAKWLKNSQE
jgi:cation transport ATPase